MLTGLLQLVLKMYPRQFKILIVLNLTLIVSGVVVIKVTKIECEHSEKYLYNHTCSLKPINRYKTVAFLESGIRDAIRNVTTNIAFYARNSANAYKPYLVNFTANLCRYLDKKVSSIYVNFFMNTLKKYSNVNHTCPYRGSFIAKEFYVDGSSIQAELIPRNAYKIIVVFYEGYPLEFLGKVIFYADVFDKK